MTLSFVLLPALYLQPQYWKLWFFKVKSSKQAFQGQNYKASQTNIIRFTLAAIFSILLKGVWTWHDKQKKKKKKKKKKHRIKHCFRVYTNGLYFPLVLGGHLHLYFHANESRVWSEIAMKFSIGSTREVNGTCPTYTTNWKKNCKLEIFRQA